MADIPEELRTELSQSQFSNGRAALAALYYRCIRTPDGKRWPLSELLKLEKMRLIPTSCDRLSAANARKILDAAGPKATNR